MSKTALFAVLALFVPLCGLSAADVSTLWEDHVFVGGAEHRISLVRTRDNGRDEHAFVDIIAGPGLPGVKDVTLRVAYPSGSFTPSSLRVEVAFDEWRYLGGDMTFTFPSDKARLAGRPGSRVREDGDFVAFTQAGSGLDALRGPALASESVGGAAGGAASASGASGVTMRLSVTGVGPLDIALPVSLFGRAFAFSREKLDQLESAGVPAGR